ncbi:MAG: SufD family Fe-S cluster assembly protein [Bacteroidales bacterium]|nr:SufD family Fe-S cluster assembly protein [Bacteroidales bacterium]
MAKVYLIGKDAVPGRISLGKGELLDMVLVALPGVSADIGLEVDLDGENAELNLYGLYLCPNEERLNINVKVAHNVGRCTSRQLFKGIVGGRSRTGFYGLIYVAKDAQQTKAYQENHNLQLSEEAKVETRPQLEIYADDVECSHGATVGKLDEQEQFYMRSRGIPEDKARELQMISFISSVAAQVEDETLREKIYDSLSEC